MIRTYGRNASVPWGDGSNHMYSTGGEDRACRRCSRALVLIRWVLLSEARATWQARYDSLYEGRASSSGGGHPGPGGIRNEERIPVGSENMLDSNEIIVAVNRRIWDTQAWLDLQAEEV